MGDGGAGRRDAGEQRRAAGARTLLANALRRFPDALHTIEIDAARAQLDELTRG
jgi:hypothetical protein